MLKQLSSKMGCDLLDSDRRRRKSLEFWFVPSNTNHIAKNTPLLRYMREVGHNVRIVCLDNILENHYRTLGQIKSLEFEYELVPSGGFRTDCPSMANRFRIARSLFHAREARRIPTIVNNFLKTHKRLPDALIFGSETDAATRSLVKASRRMGVPSILIVDGIYLPKNLEFPGGVLQRCRLGITRRLSHAVRRSGVEGTSGVELFFVINGTSKANLISNGLLAENIHIVGSPEFALLEHRMQGMSDEDYRVLRRRLGILSDAPVLAYSHQPLQSKDMLERMLKAMVDGCRRAGAVLLVKFHPRSQEYPDVWRRWAEARGFDKRQIVFVREECTSQDTVLVCSAFITLHSTVLMEALTCRRPMVFIKFISTEYVLPFGRQYGIGLDVDRIEDLAPSVASILSDAVLRQRLLANYPRAIENELNGLKENAVDVMLEKIECFLEMRRETKPVPFYD
jgi:hypothetical protein